MTRASTHRSPVLLAWLVLAQWRAQPARLAAALIAIAIGVCLGLAIELVNRSAIGQFDRAMAVVQGEAQASLGARVTSVDEALFDAVLAEPRIAAASPVIEIRATLAGRSVALLGLDPMRAAGVTPGLLPQAEGAGSGSALFADDTVFLSPALLQASGLRVGDSVPVQAGLRAVRLRVAGTVPGAAPGQALAVMDLGALQWHFGWLGRLTRIDLRLTEGVDPGALGAEWRARLPPEVAWSVPRAGAAQEAGLSRAYRVNLTVLALVALFTGGFIVHATLALMVARQSPVLALLAVLGARQSFVVRVVLAQALLLGLVGGALGVLAGLGAALGLLRHVGPDLGGGFFGATQAELALDPWVLIGFLGLGLLTALAGAVSPCWALRRLAPARALRHGLDEAPAHPGRAAWGIVGLAVPALALSQAPAWAGLPIGAYLSIGLLLLAGIRSVVPLTALAGRLAALGDPAAWRHPPGWLAVQRVRAAPQAAGVALSGVVASFALASAMTIMVDSFRASVTDWLDAVLPADLYGRAGAQGAGGAIGTDLQARIRALPGVERAEFLRSLDLTLEPGSPRVSLLVREIDPAQASSRLPLVGPRAALPPGARAAWVSEAMARRPGWEPGSRVRLPLGSAEHEFVVIGIWRDYARLQGSVVITAHDYRALTGDRSANDLALSLRRDVEPGTVMEALRELSPQTAALELRSAREIRELSLRIFDRSFAITYVLEAVAIVVGLFGVAATYAGQALARAREFGVLRHLGLTRRAVVGTFALEAALLIGIGIAWGTALGAAIALILIHRVNPQSFHWTMAVHWPVPTLAAAGAALFLVGVLTAVLAARSAAGQSPVRAVRQDW